MSTSTCPNCGSVVIHQAWDRKPHRIAGPFPADIRLSTTHCRLCRQDIFVVQSPQMVDHRVFAWTTKDEGRFMKLLPDPLVPRNTPVFIAWNPIPDRFNESMWGRIHGMNRQNRFVVLTPPATDPLLAMRSGPLPAIAIEQCVRRFYPGASHIYHFWPAATLATEDYIPLGTDAELQQAWAEHARDHIELSIPNV